MNGGLPSLKRGIVRNVRSTQSLERLGSEHTLKGYWYWSCSLALACVLYQRKPLVLSLDFDSAQFCRCSILQGHVWPHIIVENLIARQNRRVLAFQIPHNLLPVANLAVEPFHLVIVKRALAGRSTRKIGSAIWNHTEFLRNDAKVVGWFLRGAGDR